MAAKSRERRHLEELTDGVIGFLNQFDELAKQPSTPERGSRLAKLCNALELLNDQSRYFGLGVDFRRDRKRKRPDASGRFDRAVRFMDEETA